MICHSRLYWAGAPTRGTFLTKCIATHDSSAKEEETVAKKVAGPGGAGRDRTDDLRLAKPALSQLSYSPLLPTTYLYLFEVARSMVQENLTRESSHEVKRSRPAKRRTFPFSGLPVPSRQKLVGLGGLEPPTSRLSGGRSNQAELQAPRNSKEFRDREDLGSGLAL